MGNLRKPLAEPVFATEIFGKCQKLDNCEAMPRSEKPCEAGFQRLPVETGDKSYPAHNYAAFEHVLVVIAGDKPSMAFV